MNDAVFAQLSTLGSSLVLLFGIIAVAAQFAGLHPRFPWQSLAAGADLRADRGYFGDDPRAVHRGRLLVVLKVIIIPRYLTLAYERVGGGAKRSLTSTSPPRWSSPGCWCRWPTPSRARW